MSNYLSEYVKTKTTEQQKEELIKLIRDCKDSNYIEYIFTYDILAYMHWAEKGR